MDYKYESTPCEDLFLGPLEERLEELLAFITNGIFTTSIA